MPGVEVSRYGEVPADVVYGHYSGFPSGLLGAGPSDELGFNVPANVSKFMANSKCLICFSMLTGTGEASTYLTQSPSLEGRTRWIAISGSSIDIA